MTAYYNEHDPYAAQWLRNLIEHGLIADGDVDERDIQDVRPSDIKGYSQCHFFAGVGGWSYALRLAGVPDDYPIWTGSPPCQPFSKVGKKVGRNDERHLWPVFFDLIRECSPSVVFGEQVESAIKVGWLDAVCDDFDSINYASGKAIIPACGIGSPHIRRRLFWVACGMADSNIKRLAGWTKSRERPSQKCTWSNCQTDHTQTHKGWKDPDWLFCRDGKWRPVEPGSFPLVDGLPAAVDGLGPISRVGALKGAGNAIVPQVAQVFIESFFEAIGEMNEYSA
jgi:DNA (cytosine-5)-methyltransferase 1